MDTLARTQPTADTSLIREFSAKADAFTRATAFGDFRALKSKRTLRSHDADLRLFAQCLGDANVITPDDIELYAGALATSADAWRDIDYGVVAAFRVWMLHKGYALSTVSHALSTVKVYSGLASDAGAIDAREYANMRSIGGWTGREALRKDEQRITDGLPTRRGKKRTTAEMHNGVVSASELRKLKAYPDSNTPQGRRDRVILVMAIDYGLRVGEIEQLVVNGMVDLGNGNVRWVGVDLEDGLISVYHEKTHLVRVYRQTPDARQALHAWINSGDCPPMGYLLRGSVKGGRLGASGMTRGAISERIRKLSKEVIGRELSPHDLRHSAVTARVQAMPDRIHELAGCFGWKPGSRMIHTYAKELEIANANGLDGSV